MWAALAFLFIFVLMMPQIRVPLFERLGGAGDWIGKWAPFSYIVLALFLAATIAALVIMIKWPAPPKPEDPLAKYKKQDIEMD
ncbi:MAG: hypothetical protein ABSH49_18020 [Bryobacteraceae bacterium]|jgi:hypothetical protein